MKIELDPDRLEEMLDTWRKSVDLQIPMMDDFKIRMMKNRREILENFLQTGTGWTLMLSCMEPLDDSQRFDVLRAQVKAFVDWAASELDSLAALR
ncbi:MAG TPA: hypothetical protein VEC01_17465 [Noviherbaspirillum sp.]|uniref:hypothetical protein n=1 Tax=Noviherbaspirillum sp. TaxID=1926288 RepID=UPI002D4DDE52|nr:hypothetical protein [Noviherbaspirillum sp.]HYD97121.1 hypothetical protein [Noviherbaspirillum sp.]